jgi:hypothetical protein
MTRGVPDTTARYDRSVYVAKLQSDGEPAYEPAMNRIRPSRVLVLLLRTHTRRKTLLTALQVLQVLASESKCICIARSPNRTYDAVRLTYVHSKVPVFTKSPALASPQPFFLTASALSMMSSFPSLLSLSASQHVHGPRARGLNFWFRLHLEHLECV